LAAQIATTLVNAYLDHNFKQKYEAINRSGWMEQQLAELKGQVRKITTGDGGLTSRNIKLPTPGTSKSSKSKCLPI
jgi:hypothetical protein